MSFKFWFKKYKSLIMLGAVLTVALAFLCARFSKLSAEVEAAYFPPSELTKHATADSFFPASYLDRTVLLPTLDFEVSLPSEEIYSDSSVLITGREGIYILSAELYKKYTFKDMLAAFGEIDTFEDVDVSYSESVSDEGYHGLYSANYSAGTATIQYKTKYIKWYCMRYEVALSEETSLCIMTLTSDKDKLETAKDTMDSIFESIKEANTSPVVSDTGTDTETVETESEDTEVKTVTDRIGIYVTEDLPSAYAVVVYDYFAAESVEIVLANSSGKKFSLDEELSSDGKAVFYIGECKNGLYTYTITAAGTELPPNEGKIMTEEELADFLSQ